MKAGFLFVFTLLGLSPILKTLTADTSDDTIWALSVLFFLGNLLLHDYTCSHTTNIEYPGSLSTNAAIFASVLLASRLPSNGHVFVLMLFAVETFALFPLLRRSIKVYLNQIFYDFDEVYIMLCKFISFSLSVSMSIFLL